MQHSGLAYYWQNDVYDKQAHYAAHIRLTLNKRHAYGCTFTTHIFWPDAGLYLSYVAFV